MHKCTSYGQYKLSLWPFWFKLSCVYQHMSYYIYKQTYMIYKTGFRRKSVYLFESVSQNDHFIIWPSSVTLTFNLPEQMFQKACLLLKDNNCAILFWNPWIYVQVMTQTSSVYGHFIIWPLSVTLNFNLPEQMFQMEHLLLKNNNCTPQEQQLYQIILKSMYKCAKVYDHCIIWPSSVTLTFNLPEQMFQMALLLLKDNNWAKLFWNPLINVQVMAQTSSVYDNFIIWPSIVTLTFNLPKQMFQKALLLLKDNNCAILFWNPCINVHVMARTNLDGCMHACKHNARTQTEIVTTMFCSPQAGWIKRAKIHRSLPLTCKSIFTKHSLTRKLDKSLYNWIQTLPEKK